ncbi:transcription factor-like 5 protein isoform X2 [Betta splendens]|uniref:Transcription factor-like 5 protein isoform X2 n=1 Tax=Betta splendens TaxID=158456 RepID=A0A6P7MVR8_BETSP|nr:transcription factor-like 5 protein isoform X2 [Betta splendens]
MVIAKCEYKHYKRHLSVRIPGSFAPTSVNVPVYTAACAATPVYQLNAQSIHVPATLLGSSLSHSGRWTHDHMLMFATGLGLMEMTDAEYAHLQHLIQANMEAQPGPPDGPDVEAHPATGISPSPATHAIDLSTSTEEHFVLMPGYGEKTPVSYGDVPGYVLAKIRGEDSPIIISSSSSSATSQNRSRTAVRVCLEKRFNNMSAEMPRTQNLQSAVLNNFLSILQQTAESQEEVTHSQMQKWMKSDGMNPFEVSSPYVGDVFNSVTNTCGQMIGHIPYIIEPDKRQGFIIPKSFSLQFHPERIVTKAHCMGSLSPADEQHSVNIQNMATSAASKKHGHTHNLADAGSSIRKRMQSCMSPNQRRERHNCKERERRKRIRLYCDELNMLVPFCNSDTDKVTTLQWTTAYLTYVNKSYGDTLKAEFQKTFTYEKEVSVTASTSSSQENEKCLITSLEVEQ